jgi:Zn-dependent protease
MNFIMAFIFIIIYYTIQILIINQTIVMNQTWYIIILILQSTATINVALGIFNLIPLPPLDGSKILMHFLPYNAKQWFYNNQTIFYIIFLLLFITGLSRYIVHPIFQGVYNFMKYIVANIFRLFI